MPFRVISSWTAPSQICRIGSFHAAIGKTLPRSGWFWQKELQDSWMTHRLRHLIGSKMMRLWHEPGRRERQIPSRGSVRSAGHRPWLFIRSPFEHDLVLHFPFPSTIADLWLHLATLDMRYRGFGVFRQRTRTQLGLCAGMPMEFPAAISQNAIGAWAVNRKPTLGMRTS